MSAREHPSRSERIGSLLEMVGEVDPAQREALLRAQCGEDESLIEEVLSLAAALEGAGEFLETPAAESRTPLRDLTGTSIGPFQVRRRLGEGGMGQVYEAIDTRLDRTVALKVLHPSLASSATVRARLAREARALAQLNHPGIAAIYGLEACQHAPGGIVLILEYVPGITLAARLRQGPLELSQALHIGMAIADALETAHARGIIHRDLKPSNIMLDPADEHGPVKILDFGLAKAMLDRPTVSATQPPSSLHEPTPASSAIPVHVTTEGDVMGTAAYMSPEQARGAFIDRRTDIWSLGCVIAEMLVGKRIFDRGTAADTVAAVLKEDPPLTGPLGALPPAIQAVLLMCLKKDVRERLRDAGDVKLLLAAAGASGSPAAIARRPTSLRLAMVAACAGLAIAAGWMFARVGRSEVKPQPRLAFDVSLGSARVQDNESNPIAATRDSLILATEEPGGPLLLRHSLIDGTTTRINGTNDASSPFIFADGRSIGYFDSRQGMLMRLNVPGQPPIQMAKVGSNVIWPVALPNGDVIFARRWSSGLLRVRSGETVQENLELTPALGPASVRPSCVLPDGITVLATIASQSSSARTLEAVDTHRSTRTHILDDASEGYYIGNNTLLFLRNDTLLAVGFDPGTLRTNGKETLVASGIGLTGLVNTGLVEATVDGTVLFVPHDPASSSSLSVVGADHALRPIVTDPVCITDPAFAPDGKRIAATRYGETACIWVFDTSTSPPTQLQISRGVHATRPVWSPDGTRIAFVGFAPFPPIKGHEGMQLELPNGTGLYIADGSGTTTPKLVYSGGQYATRLYDWVPDGSGLAVAIEKELARGFDIFILNLNDPSSMRPFIATDASEYGMRFSHDGTWMAFTRDTGGASEVYAAPWPRGTPLVRVTPHGGYRARWSRDDSTIYFQNDQGLFSIAVDPRSPGLVAGGPTQLDTGLVADQYDIAPDGSPLTVTFRQPRRSSIRVLTGVRHDAPE